MVVVVVGVVTAMGLDGVPPLGDDFDALAALDFESRLARSRFALSLILRLTSSIGRLAGRSCGVLYAGGGGGAQTGERCGMDGWFGCEVQALAGVAIGRGARIGVRCGIDGWFGTVDHGLVGVAAGFGNTNIGVGESESEVKDELGTWATPASGRASWSAELAEGFAAGTSGC